MSDPVSVSPPSSSPGVSPRIETPVKLFALSMEDGIPHMAQHPRGTFVRLADYQALRLAATAASAGQIFVDRDGCEWRLAGDAFEFRDEEEREQGADVWTPATIKEWTSRTNNENWRYWLGFFGSMVRV